MKAPALNIHVKEVAKQIMDKLGLSVPIRIDFEANNQVHLFENGEARRIALGSPLDNDIKDLERERNLKIYAVTHECLPTIGETYSYLSVSPYPEDWDHMAGKTSDGYYTAYAYVRNVMIPEYSESGYVVVTSKNGVITRVG